MHWRGPGRPLLTLVLFLSYSVCQNLSIPSQWRKPSSSLPRTSRETIAQSVIDSLFPLFNATSGQIDTLEFHQSASLISAIALHDSILSLTNSSNVLTAATHLKTVLRLHPGFYLTSVRDNETISIPYKLIILGPASDSTLTLFHAYHASGDAELLDIASSIWNEVHTYFITTENAANGTHPTRSVGYNSTCKGASTAGGVFYRVDETTSTDVNGATIGGFMALSAHLFEATSIDEYKTSTGFAADFIKSLLYDGTTILDTITLASCAVNSYPASYNPGYFIEGLSIFVNRTGDAEWKSLLDSLISTTIKLPAWTGENGVIIEPSRQSSTALSNGFEQALKGIFIRGLYEAWTRSPRDSDVAKLIEAFISVQYNALLDLASPPGIYQFSPQWNGPSINALLPWGQLAALDVLNAAVGMTDPSSSIVTSSSATETPTATPTVATGRSKTSKGVTVAIAVVVSVVAVAIIAVVCILVRRRRQKSESMLEMRQHGLGKEMSQDESTASSPHIVPFPLTASMPPSTPTESRYPPSTSSPTGAPSSKSNPPVDTTDAQLRPTPELLLASQRPVGEMDSEEIPALIQRLNRALARLPPPSGVPLSDDEESPPEYHER